MLKINSMLNQKHINNLNEALNYYDQWMISKGLDPIWGYLIPETYKVTLFDRQPLDHILLQIQKVIADRSIIDLVKQMPSLNLKIPQEFANNYQRFLYYKDLLYLHEGLASIIGGFMFVERETGKKDQQIYIPFNIADPFAKSSQELGIKKGVTTIFPAQWQLRRDSPDLENFNFNDIKLKFSFGQKTEQQHLFYGSSIISSVHLTRVLKLIYEINCYVEFAPENEEAICHRLKLIEKCWDKIIALNEEILFNFDGEYFYYHMRNKFDGYKNVNFEGYDEPVTASGGNGGYDPMFQIFERAFGISYNCEEITKIQETIKGNGMINIHRNLIESIQKQSMIRQYCQVSDTAKIQYNKVIEKYEKFYHIHTTFIRNFIMKFKNEKTGVSGIKISSLMHKDIVIKENQMK